MKYKKVIVTSGFFNPIHKGHINLLKGAKELGGFLVVIVNNDEQVKIKGSVPFMTHQERMEIIKALQYVDEVFPSVDKGLPIARSLALVAEKYQGKELFFAKGGDRNASNIPDVEKEVCEKFHITIVNGVGGDKVQSSSHLLSNVKNI